MRTAIVLAVLAIGFLESDAQTLIKIYEHEDLKGANLPVRLTKGQCYDVQRIWDKQASSIDIGRACVILFTERGCAGRGVRLPAENMPDGGTTRLQAVDMNDEMSSISLCD